MPGIKLPDITSGLAANAGQSKVWAALRDAVSEAEDMYSLAAHKELPCLGIPDGLARLVLVTRQAFAEEIEDMPLARLRLGDQTYRAFLASEYSRARADCRVPHCH